MSNHTLAAETKVREYLDSFVSSREHATVEQFPRVTCCKPSQSMYCKTCCRLVVPDECLPLPIRQRKNIICSEKASCDEATKTDTPDQCESDINKECIARPLRLPFNLHIILDDRRGSSTGVHAIALLGDNECKHSAASCELQKDQNPCSGGACKHRIHKELRTSVLTDVEKLEPDAQSVILEDALKTYDQTSNDEGPSTYFLFPYPGESVPLEEVSNNVKTLIVLDCKWTKSGVWRRSERLRRIPKVHLSNPPKVSHFWRWHNAGPGMMSTIEAIYYASLEVCQSRYKQLLLDSSPQSSLDECVMDEENLIHLLWLFGQQRLATMEKATVEGKTAPCCEDGKEIQRALRRRKMSWRPK